MENPLQDLARRQLDTNNALASVFAASASKLVAEATHFAELTFQNNSGWLRDLMKVRSMPEFFQVQNENAKANYAAAVGQARKIGDIFSEMVEAAVKATPRPSSGELTPVKIPRKAA